MGSKEIAPIVQVGHGADGALTYLVDLPPEALPPVTGRDLDRAWHAARQAALAENWGGARAFRFRRGDGEVLELALADTDARCWAGAVDRTAGMANSYGLSLCLRLLALVDLLSRVGWASQVILLARDGAELHPSLLAAAAAIPLTPEARFDPARFRAHLNPILAPAPGSIGQQPTRLTGVA